MFESQGSKRALGEDHHASGAGWPPGSGSRREPGRRGGGQRDGELGGSWIRLDPPPRTGDWTDLTFHADGRLSARGLMGLDQELHYTSQDAGHGVTRVFISLGPGGRRLRTAVICWHGGTRFTANDLDQYGVTSWLKK